MRLDRLLRQEERLPDLAIHETLGDQLEHLDLARRRLLLELPQGRRERDDLRIRPSTPSGRLLEAAGMVDVPTEDFLALGRVHELAIGTRARAL